MNSKYKYKLGRKIEEKQIYFSICAKAYHTFEELKTRIANWSAPVRIALQEELGARGSKYADSF